MSSRFHNATLVIITASCALTSLVGCGRAASPGFAQIVLDERIKLTRDDKPDSAVRTWIARDDATCVVIVEEDDSDVTVRLEGKGNAASGPPVVVESLMNGAGIEVATLHVSRATQVVLFMTAPPVGNDAGIAPTKVTCYPDGAEGGPSTAIKLAAFRAWTQATPAGPLNSAQASERIASMDSAISTLESPAGDARMAAWAKLVRAHLLYGREISWSESFQGAQAAERAFAALAPVEPRNQERARFLAATALVKIMRDADARDPTDAEARALASAMLKELELPHSAMSAVEHFRVIDMHGVYCYEIQDYACAEERWKTALDGVRAAGALGDTARILANQGILARARRP